ncbi:hypothetical protein P7228_15090 [Altererythrobacter arenosus]|uniref:Glycerophosphoryl diester phosphodiesterase membrane domain-containing protein n=1 Tax=Altererythrobacter arenosus TaxID=3032592 RepID=A0ABY8FQM3_9SPHN|nr:hypothetical protein [Altererythrobacter sp. CAU 1644]WFL77295.1 hypothetical protein P7228_15090 [Altererythrobacter sp. CAU 1644]
MNRNKDFAGFLGQALDLLGANIAAVLVFVLVLGGLSSFGLMAGFIEESDTFASFGFSFIVDATDSLASVAYEIGVAIITIVASYLLLARFLESAGRLRDTETRIWAYVGMAILSGLAIALGFVLLIVPGLILMVRWSAASGFLIGARRGVTESLGASWEATRGYSWPIFFAGVVLLIGVVVVGGALGGAVGFAGNDLAIAIVSSVAEAASSAIFLAFGIGVYLLLQDDAEEIGEVFA